MKINFLGTCAGTEPIEGFRHVSFTITTGNRLFWFDAGENCSYAAHLGGIDLFKSRAVFLSHTHMDHVGGLPNLLWNIRKLNTLPKKKSSFSGKVLDIFSPDPRLTPAILKILSCTEGGFAIDFNIRENPVEDKIIFNEDGFKVLAVHNHHLGQSDGKWQSFSYRIECEGKMIVYSGDLKEIEEIDGMTTGADLVLIETGHHHPGEICLHFRELKNFSGKLGFIHHGRAIIDDFYGELEKARKILGKRVFFAKEGQEMEMGT
ncbi:MAG TPA: hypothetical protein DCZ94_17380 [Lentisphaeria bacterium]|nr:MAG: hypothetical protein A2X48_20800 [Lentisphaerae bacterium GWF2_49_21]HBC88716.1 hypothetical protein [Lentisphaeria bacterium]